MLMLKIVWMVLSLFFLLTIGAAVHFYTTQHSVFIKKRKRRKPKVSDDVVVNEQGKLVDLNVRYEKGLK